jgi:hypothetical protein
MFLIGIFLFVMDRDSGLIAIYTRKIPGDVPFKIAFSVLGFPPLFTYFLPYFIYLFSVVVKALCYKPEGRGFDTR